MAVECVKFHHICTYHRFKSTSQYGSSEPVSEDHHPWTLVSKVLVSMAAVISCLTIKEINFEVSKVLVSMVEAVPRSSPFLLVLFQKYQLVWQLQWRTFLHPLFHVSKVLVSMVEHRNHQNSLLYSKSGFKSTSQYGSSLRISSILRTFSSFKSTSQYGSTVRRAICAK